MPPHWHPSWNRFQIPNTGNPQGLLVSTRLKGIAKSTDYSSIVAFIVFWYRMGSAGFQQMLVVILNHFRGNVNSSTQLSLFCICFSFQNAFTLIFLIRHQCLKVNIGHSTQGFQHFVINVHGGGVSCLPLSLVNNRLLSDVFIASRISSWFFNTSMEEAERYCICSSASSSIWKDPPIGLRTSFRCVSMHLLSRSRSEIIYA